MTQAIKAIVVAGGRGCRLHLRRPKSSLEFGGRSLIWWTVRSLRDAGIEAIDVFVDDVKWAEEYRAQLRGLGIEVISDPGYPSTFILFREHCPSRGACLFTYGHAPRSAQYYSDLLASDAPLVASVVKETSMRRRISGPRGEALEPPFLIRVPDVDMRGASNWQQFFEMNLRITSLKSHLTMGEFNFEHEWAAYQRYMRETFTTAS